MRQPNKPLKPGQARPGSKNYRKYSIEDPDVRAFAEFKATPIQLREAKYGEGIRDEVAYIHSLGMQGTQPPSGWFNAIGFWKLVEKLEAEFKSENVLLAMNTLQKRMQGMKVVKTRIKKDAGGQVVERTTEIEESLPSVHAADVMLRACGKIKSETLEAVENLAAVMTKAAEMRRKK
jgi:hypothetical protein